MNCSKCGTPLQPGWRACPNCGLQFAAPVPGTPHAQGYAPVQTQPQKGFSCLRAIGLFFLIIIALGVIGSLAGNHDKTASRAPLSVGASDTSSESAPSTTSGSTSDYSIANLTSHKDESGMLHIEGDLTNNTDDTKGYVQVEINVYKGDTQLGSTLANTNNLEPHKTWHFSAIAFEDGADSFKVKDVTGF